MPSRFPLYVVIQILRTFLSEDRVYLSQIKKATAPAWWTEKVHWGFFSYFVLYFFIFWNGVSLCNWLPWNSLCRPPGWSAIHKEPVLPDLLGLKSAPPMSESLQDPWWHRLLHHWKAPLGMVYNSENLHHWHPLYSVYVVSYATEQHPHFQWRFTAYTTLERSLVSLVRLMFLKVVFEFHESVSLSSGRECFNPE